MCVLSLKTHIFCNVKQRGAFRRANLTGRQTEMISRQSCDCLPLFVLNLTPASTPHFKTWEWKSFNEEQIVPERSARLSLDPWKSDLTNFPALPTMTHTYKEGGIMLKKWFDQLSRHFRTFIEKKYFSPTKFLSIKKLFKTCRKLRVFASPWATLKSAGRLRGGL